MDRAGRRAAVGAMAASEGRATDPDRPETPSPRGGRVDALR